MKKDLDSTHVFQNGTGQQLIDSIEDVAKRLSTIAIVKSADIDLTNYEHIQKIVQLGMAKDYFEIGDQIHTTWKPDEEHEYDMPWDVVDFGPCEDPDGNIHENAMWLQSHYSIYGDVFDDCEAFYVTPEEMPAGTYHFTLGVNTKSISANSKIQFTLSNPLPAKGQLAFCDNNGTVVNMAKRDLNGFKIGTFTSGQQADCIELVEVSIGDDGSDLGTLTLGVGDRNYGFNDINRCIIGSNRWSQSNIRQWLNSDPGIENWWKPQSNFDRAYKEYTLKKNFKSCLQLDFLRLVKPILITISLSKQYKQDVGSYEKTHDMFFLPSIKNYFGKMSGIENEGKEFKYYTEVKEQQGTFTKEDLITKKEVKNLFLRTPYPSSVSGIFAIAALQVITSRNADASNGHAAPCCVIY